MTVAVAGATVATLAIVGLLVAIARAFCTPERARATARRVLERPPLFGGGLVATMAGMVTVTEADAVRIQAHLAADATGFLLVLVGGYIVILLGLSSITLATRWPVGDDEDRDPPTAP